MQVPRLPSKDSTPATAARIGIVETSGPAYPEALARNVQLLRQHGFAVDCRTPDHRRTDRREDLLRASDLTAALTDDDFDAVFAARGGYGASDLLPLMNWDRLSRCSPKPLVGFSDVTALQCALYTRLGWASIHGPMPGSNFFGQHTADVDALLNLLKRPLPWHGSLHLDPATTPGKNHSGGAISGWLFGGCLSVLTNLIGTPWFPYRLSGAIVYLEDVGESPARIGRYWTQWQQSGAAAEIAAVVLGNFTEMSRDADAEDRLYEEVCFEIRRRSQCQVFVTRDFGHVSPNFPLVLGAKATIEGNRLRWRHDNHRLVGNRQSCA